MVARSMTRGHATHWNGKNWVVTATGELVHKTTLKCPECKLDCEPKGPDPCLGILPGVAHACCGHGDRRKAYVKFQNGLTIYGWVFEKPWANTTSIDTETGE